MPRAIIFIPPDDPDDARHAREGLNYLDRRGYGFYAVLRRLDIALSLLAEGRVNVVRFSPSDDLGRDPGEQPGDEGPTRRLPDCASATVRSGGLLRVLRGGGDVQRPVESAETPWERRQRLNAYLDDAARRLRRGCGEAPASIIRVIDGGAD